MKINDELLTEIKAVVSKHEKKIEPTDVTRWIPICEEYKTAQVCSVYHEKGGKTIIGRRGQEVKVLYWAEVRIDPVAMYPHEKVRVLCCEEPYSQRYVRDMTK